NYLSMIAYVNINNSLNEPGNQNIEKFFSIYKLVDPENPDYYYYRALYNYNTGDNNLVINNLNKSVELGFNDWNKLKNDFSLEIFEFIHK
ncbi:MAG: hypothetical protein JXB17_04990, partial [Bacteroidales bacterium]|nr:hypothetical protein [Bacteroidales bacterium]